MSTGYRALCVDGVPKPGLSCVHCEGLLRNPVQTEEGQRLCKACFQIIRSLPGGECQKCDVVITSDSYYPDKAVQREVLALLVWCLHRSLGCQWQGVLKDWEVHCANCTFKGIACPNNGCDLTFILSDLEKHKMECLYRLIKCDHCTAQIPFNKKNDHDSSCEAKPIICGEAGCFVKFPRSQLSHHKNKECTVEKCLTCDKKVCRKNGREIPQLVIAICRGMGKESLSHVPEDQVTSNSDPTSSIPLASPDDTRDKSQNGRVHLSDPIQNFQHHQQLALYVRDLEGVVTVAKDEQAVVTKEWAGVKDVVTKLRDEKAALQSELSSVKTELSDIRNMMRDVKRQMDSGQTQRDDKQLRVQVGELLKADKEKDAVLQLLRTKLEDIKTDLELIQRTGGGGIFGGMAGIEKDNINSGISRKGGAVESFRGHTALSSAGFESSMQVHHKVEEISRQMTMMRVQMSELELQLQASLASTYNGAFLWRIPDITRRRRDALEGRVTSIYSPPFYTGRNGYKMCIRGYLNGDGMGYQSHLSLFFVIMRGECDPLLKWPFDHKVSMILVDQTHRKHIVQTFKPTPESNSFQQPKTDMNVASGCPQFAKLSIFEDPCYVRDDIMFIKCIVDTTKIFHP